MSFVHTQRLDYIDHSEEIASLNRVLADIQACQPFPPELQATVERLIARIDHLMLSSRAVLSTYDQHEERR
jgi:chemotaxis regulatin CheY-phosphate phosphatase CheZ